MNYEEMSLTELKEYAKRIGLSVGNIGKEKLIVKIKEKENLSNVIEDSDLEKNEEKVELVKESVNKNESNTLLESITSAIDDLEDSTGGKISNTIDELPIDTVIPVKSIKFGGLTYRSRSTNATFRWSQIGAIEYMTIADLNEMNNFKPSFLNKPLVILMDERAIKKFRLTPVYENVAKINNLKSVFNSDMTSIEETIDMALRVNMRDILISKVRQMIKNKTLVDINIIRMLERKLAFDFQDEIE